MKIADFIKALKDVELGLI